MIFARATNNAKKLKEIDRILASLGHSVKSLKELGVDVNPEENGETFADNALIKAKAVADIANLPTISDDSGLCVDRLGGAPGVHTARYAGENATDDENIDKLLNRLENLPDKDRGAAFVSSVCLYMPERERDNFVICTGECRGYIAHERQGQGGFGYDPVFMVEGKSYASMSREEKDAISHRGSALRQLAEKIAEIYK